MTIAPVHATAHRSSSRTRHPAETDARSLVVLDAHGVVFNRAFPILVRRRALERDEDPAATWDRWRHHLRLDFWEGRTAPDTMWRRLFPGDEPAELTARLQESYERGPLFDHVAATSHRMWLLSNHHSGWLIPQLRRFALADRFERILVSDELGMAKPSPQVFELVRREAGAGRVLLLDDSAANVVAARRAGLDAHRVGDPAHQIDAPRPDGT